MPTKGALTQIRDRISYRFFQDQFDALKNDFKRHQKTYKGFRVYGIDGDIYSIVRNKKTLKEKFYGLPVPGHPSIKEKKETHFLRMYVVTAVDVFSGIPVDLL
ncbi:MAG: hypothetical protein HQK49_15400 [Oligoflexia bacterium]|nr:hypothetical protein [Oligoflexia bacterium]